MSYSDQFEVDSVKSYIDFYIRTRYHLCNVPKTNECLARVRHYLSINANGSNIKSGTQALSRYKNRTTVPTRENAFKIVLALKMTYEEAVQFLKFCGYRLVEDSLLLKSDIVISEAIKKRIYDNNVIDKMLVDNGSDPLFAR